ncbi:hypothetical protein PACTADRAFT_75506 [Pachysolen tannophilus NRRL Y-2460]|uniref:Cytochrome b5 heme-binding domain-containing protein n=1 Tax=Pachysolen tannophilus NRRL Y-2460 TaxID=669874 RepID=A0A1E4TX95_PACTA|nr:hypothetical protein PACTADRAFT_75506 [Pachysolen tannophilus NRRL Y-2460]
MPDSIVITDDPISLGSNSSKDDEEPVLEGKFTPKTLYKFNGFDTEKIYIGVKGKVYDVSKGRNFYGPSGPYSNFAGHDASRGLALNSFDLECVRSFDEPLDPLDDLTREQQASLDGWEEMFKEKYPCIGTLVNEDDL